MEHITQENLQAFKPDYPDYPIRVTEVASNVGVDSAHAEPDYDWGLQRWNRESAIGFSEDELDIIKLVYSVAKDNKRYDNDPFLHPNHGGNTASHPMFMGIKYDHLKREAGFGPDQFDAQSPETLWMAKLSQKVHGMMAIHDVGELVDVSFGEQLATGASKKEPDEEALVAPFQFKLAAYALSQNDPDIYRTTMNEMKERALKAKQHYFEEAQAGKITGDEFVDAFGKVIGEEIAQAEAKMGEQSIEPAYKEAIQSLHALFEEAEQGNTFAAKVFYMIDKLEGCTHYARYISEGAKFSGANMDAADEEEAMLNRVFGDGQTASFHLAHSSKLVDGIGYSQVAIIPAFEALKEVPKAHREAAEKLVRSIAADKVRSRIPMYQKGPPLIDFSADNKNEPQVNPKKDEPKAGFATRLETQKNLKAKALPIMRARKGHVDSLEGVLDAKAVIAVFEKTADAIENGSYTPTGKPGSVIPIGEPLPDALKVSPAELKAAAKKYPLETATQYKRDRFNGEAVRI